MNPVLQRRRRPRFLWPSARTPLPRLAVLVTFVVTGIWCAVGQSESAPLSPALTLAQETDLSQLPLTFPVQSPEVAAYFNEIARPDDIASVAPGSLFLLSQATEGQRMVAYRSWTQAQSELDALTSPVDMVMYNPEHWELTPEDEQQDLPATVQQFADFCHERSLAFMFAPDRRYAETYLSQVAPDVDAVLLQGQRLQHDPQTFAAWVLGMGDMARAANPDIQVFVQVGATRGTALEMYGAIQTVASEIDGIAVWSMPRTLHVLQEFVQLLRESPPTPSAPPPATPTSTPSVPVPTESPSALPPSATPTATQGIAVTPSGQIFVPTAADASPSPVAQATVTPAGPGSPDMGWVTDVLLFVGGMGFGLVIGLFLGRRQRRGP